MDFYGIRLVSANGVGSIRFDIFENFSDEVLAAFSTKKGGVSSGVYEAMNLSFTLGDEKANVMENYKLFSTAVGINYQDIVFADQCHHSNIRLVNGNDRGKGIIRDKDYSDIDGLITNIRGLPLVTLHADCTPIYFYDSRNKAIGLAHAGWRGTSMEIAAKMVERMNNEFDTRPEDIIAVIGPSICGSCYEVGDDVINELKKMRIDTAGYIRRGEQPGKFFPDIAGINRELLLFMGVRPENIGMGNICTNENKDMFFSHRGHHGKRGSLAAVMQLL